jgi:hypothetical protein
MCLVDDDVFPTDLLESGLLSQTHLVRSHHDVEVLGQNAFVDKFGLGNFPC